MYLGEKNVRRKENDIGMDVLYYTVISIPGIFRIKRKNDLSKNFNNKKKNMKQTKSILIVFKV